MSVRIVEKDLEIVISVRDWGPGIAPEAVPRIFEREDTTKPDDAGIGLSLVSAIVRRARGRIEVDHPRGGEVEFTVGVPR